MGVFLTPRNLAIVPGFAILLPLTGFNLLGRALRDAMERKLRGGRQ